MGQSKEKLEEKYLSMLKEINKIESAKANEHFKGYYDAESAHIDADQVLIDLLTELGYKKVVEAWEEIPRWYA